MSLLTMLYKLILGPLELLFDVVYATAYHATGNAGLSIVFLSLAMNLLVLPLYRRADAMQEEERRQSMALRPGVEHIRKTFKGNERFMMLQTLYRQHNYKPWYALKGSLSLLLEIPFFIAAYRFLSGLRLLQGVAFGPIRDLGLPDGLLSVGGWSVHLLPILMTAINLVSGAIYTRGMPLRSKAQLYGMALVFLAFLYPSPSGLVFYWTLNNVFSLVKNIFYRLRNPRRVLRGLCAALGLGLLAALFLRPLASPRKQLLLAAAAVALLMPLARGLLRRGKSAGPARTAGRGESAVFLLGCGALTVLTGVLIPSSVVRSSPAEFINPERFASPALYILSSALLAAGAFMVWGSIFYRLASPSGKRAFSLAALAAAGVGIVDFMLFGRDYGNMASTLQYDTLIEITGPQYLLNAGAALAVAAALYLLWRFRPPLARVVAAAAVAAISVTSVVNVADIQRIAADLDGHAAAAGAQATIPLDKSGRNVVVIMLDRAISGFFPYLIEEKPELKRQFDGFTYYPNTISYGSRTMVGAPPIFGGYEYTPENMNLRDDALLMDKNDEALRVMPVNFLDAGYEVTVCDPPNAGYSTVPDLSVYDDYPDIRRFITIGSFNENAEADAARLEAVWERNLFCYGVFRASPLLVQTTLYNNGLYNESNALIPSENLIQTTYGRSRAEGLNREFMDSYTALENLTGMTRIQDGGRDTFLMLDNEATHDVTLLQEPEYVPALTVDNTEYDEAHRLRRDADGGKLRLRSKSQMAHYQCNMAALLQLGRWFDWLRENGVYDNTRIIITSDHGKNMKPLGLQIGSETWEDLARYNPLMLVKDFDSRGLTTDDAFMTNADTPTLAFRDLIANPVNPATGQPITDADKARPAQYIAFTQNSNVERKRKDYVYIDLTWLEARNGMDMSAWRVLGPGELLPEP